MLTVLLLASIGLQVVNPQIIRFFIDTALEGGLLQSLMIAAGAFIGLAVLQQAVAISVTYLGETVAWTATNALRAELAWHCLNLDMDFHNEHTPGELIERIDGDLAEMATFFSQFVVGLIGNGLLIVGILLALFLEDWRVGLAFLVFTALAAILLIRVSNIAVQDQKARRQAEGDLFGFVEEQLTGTEDIRSSGAVDFSLRELFRLQANILRHDRRGRRKGWLIDIQMGGLLAVGLILLVTSGYFLYTAGWITIGTVYMFIYYMTLVETPIWAMTRQVANFQTIGACIERLTDLRKIQPRVQVSGYGNSVPQFSGNGNQISESEQGPIEVTFEGVSFAYQTGEPVLKNLSFQLKPGSVLGLLGRTGCGKTTLTRLMFRLYEPTAGQILLNQQDVRGMELQALRRRIGIVTQEVQLFRASVRDNLTFFDRGISDQRIITALEELELGGWLRGLPEGLDTLLASGGHNLSAGEAQLLAFARIFLRSPGLVILDEASSRLDPATEARIEHAIDRQLWQKAEI